MPDVDRILELSDKFSMMFSTLMSMVLIVQMIGDLLGINIFEAVKIAISRPWVIPTEWIVQYYPLWYAMEFALLVLIIFDQVYTMRCMQAHKRPPSPSYVRWMSLAIFIVSFWLAIILRYATFTLITVFAAISFSYTMFIRRG